MGAMGVGDADTYADTNADTDAYAYTDTYTDTYTDMQPICRWKSLSGR